MAKRKYVVTKTRTTLLAIIFCLSCHGQIDLSLYDNVTSDSISQNRIEAILESSDIEDFLPSLSQLIDSALVNSPEIKSVTAQLLAAEYNESMVRTDWLNLISINGIYNYGTSFLLAPTATVSPIGTTSGEVLGNIGIGVNIPLNSILNRKSRIGNAKSLVGQFVAQRALTIRNLKDEITAAYFNLLMIKKQLLIVGEGTQISVGIKESMELGFSKGTMSLEKTTTAMGYWQGSHLEYERLKTEFAVTFLNLERLVGVPFNRFND